MKEKFIKIIVVALATIIILTSLLIIYDRITINFQYSVNEANIDIPIFLYHNIVSESSQIQYDYMQTTKDVFERQISGLLDFGYHFITYDDLQKFKNNEIKLYKKSCILTFDDGYKGVYENVYPIAKKYNIPFTMFIVTGNVGEEEYITWEQAKQMQESGLATIASHSLNHEDFRNLTTEEAIKNVNESYKTIEEKLGKQRMKIFTYPYGLYNDEQIVELEKQGYVQNLTDNKINKSKNLNLSKLHRSYPLGDEPLKIVLKVLYRSIRYN